MAVKQMLVAHRYRLLEPVGAGGMGRVWLARDEMLHRDVAVKELVPPDWMTDAEQDRLREKTLREARSAARLNHPNVVRIYDVVHADGLSWIVMEYVPSRSLQQVLLEDGPYEPAVAARIGLAVLDALAAAHRAGVLHRDVKPHNVLIGTDGRVVLTDFGLATFVDDGSVTAPGLIVGSPQYVSPERARDGASTVESDLWSLGATLYAAVEGRSPYARETAMATLGALATEPPDPPMRAGPLAPVLTGLLRYQPAARLAAPEIERRLRMIVIADPREIPLLPTQRDARRDRPDGRRRRADSPREPSGPVVSEQSPGAVASGYPVAADSERPTGPATGAGRASGAVRSGSAEGSSRAVGRAYGVVRYPSGIAGNHTSGPSHAANPFGGTPPSPGRPSPRPHPSKDFSAQVHDEYQDPAREPARTQPAHDPEQSTPGTEPAPSAAVAPVTILVPELPQPRRSAEPARPMPVPGACSPPPEVLPPAVLPTSEPPRPAVPESVVPATESTDQNRSRSEAAYRQADPDPEDLHPVRHHSAGHHSTGALPADFHPVGPPGLVALEAVEAGVAEPPSAEQDDLLLVHIGTEVTEPLVTEDHPAAPGVPGAGAGMSGPASSGASALPLVGPEIEGPGIADPGVARTGRVESGIAEVSEVSTGGVEIDGVPVEHASLRAVEPGSLGATLSGTVVSGPPATGADREITDPLPDAGSEPATAHSPRPPGQELVLARSVPGSGTSGQDLQPSRTPRRTVRVRVTQARLTVTALVVLLLGGSLLTGYVADLNEPRARVYLPGPTPVSPNPSQPASSSAVLGPHSPAPGLSAGPGAGGSAHPPGGPVATPDPSAGDPMNPPVSSQSRVGPGAGPVNPSGATSATGRPSMSSARLESFSPTLCDAPPPAGLPVTPQRGAARGVNGWTLQAGWSYFTDGSGFHIALPDGWSYQRIGTTYCFRSPRNARLMSLGVGRNPTADPLAASRAEERRPSGARGLPGYALVGLAAVPLLNKAADWEYRYHSRTGAARHAVIRWFVMDGKAYTLGWSTPEKSWVSDLSRIQMIRSTFYSARSTASP